MPEHHAEAHAARRRGQLFVVLAALGGAELERLFDVIRHLAAQGVSFIYISHRLQEVFRICDRVTVLRDGAVVGTRDVAYVTQPDLVRMMVGRQLTDIYPSRERRPGEVVISVRRLTRPGVLREVDLDIRYVGFPPAALRQTSEDLALMFEWLDAVGYSVGRAALARAFPEVRWLSFAAWAGKQDWGALFDRGGPGREAHATG